VEESNCDSPNANDGLNIYKIDHPKDGTLYLQNHICGNSQHVSASQSEDTNSAEKCMSYVLNECANKDFFTWRSSNNACHCVEESNCDSPNANDGLNIYQINHPKGATLYLKNHICGNSQHVSVSLSEDTNSAEKCMSYVVNECSNKDLFTWRSSNNACHCVEESNCDSPNANDGLDIYQIDRPKGTDYLAPNLTGFYAVINPSRCHGACTGEYEYVGQENGKPRYEFVDTYSWQDESRSYTCNFKYWTGNDDYPNGAWIFDGPSCQDLNTVGTSYPGVPLNNWSDEVQQITDGFQGRR